MPPDSGSHDSAEYALNRLRARRARVAGGQGPAVDAATVPRTAAPQAAAPQTAAEAMAAARANAEADAQAPSHTAAQAQQGAQAEQRQAAPEEPVRARKIDTLFSCLLRVSREFGKPISEADVRGAVPIPDEGMGIDAFMRAAKRLGYKVRRVPLDPQNVFELPTPFVLLGAGSAGGMVVLSRTVGGFAVFQPIEGGTIQLDAANILGIGAEVVLIAPQHGTKDKTSWRSHVTVRVKGIFVHLFIASVLVNIFALASPLFMMTVYNKVIGQQALNTLNVLAIAMVMVYGFDFLLRAIRGYISTHTGARLDALLGGEVVHRLVHLPYRHFETTPTGVISERLRQLETIRQFFTGQMPLVLVDLAFVFVFLATLLAVHETMAYITLGAIPVFLAISVVFHRAQRKLVEESFQALAAKTSVLAETVANAVTVKSLGLESEMEKRWGSRLALSAWTGFRSNNLANMINVLGQVLQQGVGLAIIFVGARLVIAGEMNIGALIAANILASRALAPMRQVVTAWAQLQEVRAAFRRIDDIMEEATEAQAGELLPMASIQGNLVLDDVSYAYEQGAPLALKNVNLSIESGTIFCIMGPSGSGKSTLAKLLQGLYEPTSGRILIDQTDMRHMSTQSVRRQLGVLPQDVQLFAGTVRENIAIGTPAADPERVMAAAKFVGAHDFIQRLPKGYDTILSERGGGLSNGQKQLLCIARALMRNPKIIILDEPTSALDSASEEYFLRNLKGIAANRTIIMITHRLAPAQISDKVALVANGEVIGVGPPAEIAKMAQEGRLKRAAMGLPSGGAPQPAGTPPQQAAPARLGHSIMGGGGGNEPTG